MKRSSSRGIATLFVVALLSSVFMARLVDIQIIRAKELGRDSYLQRSKTHVIPGVRGNIVDAYNRTLAESLTQYRLVLSPSRVSDYWANGKKLFLPLRTRKYPMSFQLHPRRYPIRLPMHLEKIRIRSILLYSMRLVLIKREFLRKRIFRGFILSGSISAFTHLAVWPVIYWVSSI